MTDGTITTANASPIFTCPTHGEFLDNVITSTIPGFEGSWCMRCAVESLERIGVHRVEKK